MPVKDSADFVTLAAMLDPGTPHVRWIAREHRAMIAAMRAGRESVPGPEGSVNPRLHLALHGVVEKQFADPQMPAVREVVEALVAGGMPRHDATHCVAQVAAREMFDVMREQRAFDAAAYDARLRALLAGREALEEEDVAPDLEGP